MVIPSVTVERMNTDPSNQMIEHEVCESTHDSEDRRQWILGLDRYSSTGHKRGSIPPGQCPPYGSCEDRAEAEGARLATVQNGAVPISPAALVETEGVRVKGIPDVIDIHLEGSFASREEGRTQDSS
jgi:hypothetical protein